MMIGPTPKICPLALKYLENTQFWVQLWQRPGRFTQANIVIMRQGAGRRDHTRADLTAG